MKDRITSRTNPKVKEAAAIKGKPAAGRFLVEGFHLCEMAYKANCLLEVFALEDPRLEGVDVHLVTEEIIEKLALSKSPEGIVGVAKLPQFQESEPKRILVLDRVQDPGNVGTLLRTALCFGFGEVIFLKGSALPYSPKAIASSQGAVFSVRIKVGVEAQGLVEGLKEKGYEVVGSSLSRSVNYETYKPNKGKVALILGNEGQGICGEILCKTDLNLLIPITGIDSLNVAVAGGILMCHLRKGE